MAIIHRQPVEDRGSARRIILRCIGVTTSFDQLHVFARDFYADYEPMDGILQQLVA